MFVYLSFCSHGECFSSIKITRKGKIGDSYYVDKAYPLVNIIQLKENFFVRKVIKSKNAPMIADGLS